MPRSGKQFIVTVYSQTGFSLRHAPSSAAAVRGKASHTFADALFTRQSRWLSHMDLPTWEDSGTFFAEDADYAKVSSPQLGDMYYFITAVQYINDGCVRFFMQPDFIGSLAISNQLMPSILGGEIVRRHVSDDSEKIYIDAEPFSPSRPLIKKFEAVNPVPGGAELWQGILVSSVELEDLKLAAATFLDENGAFSTPAIPAAPEDNVTIKFSGITTEVELPLQRKILYKAEVYSSDDEKYTFQTNGVTYNLPQTIRGLGIGNVITSAYQVPKPLVQMDDSEDRITGLTSKVLTYTLKAQMTGSASDYGFSPHNKKTTYFRRRLTILSESSLSSDSYEMWELLDSPANEPVEIRINCDPTPSGCIFARPTKLKTSDDEDMYTAYIHRAVKSVVWNALTLANEGGVVFPAIMDFQLQQKQLQNAREGAAIQYASQKAALSQQMLSASIAYEAQKQTLEAQRIATENAITQNYADRAALVKNTNSSRMALSAQALGEGIGAQSSTIYERSILANMPTNGETAAGIMSLAAIPAAMYVAGGGLAATLGHLGTAGAYVGNPAAGAFIGDEITAAVTGGASAAQIAKGASSALGVAGTVGTIASKTLDKVAAGAAAFWHGGAAELQRNSAQAQLDAQKTIVNMSQIKTDVDALNANFNSSKTALLNQKQNLAQDLTTVKAQAEAARAQMEALAQYNAESLSLAGAANANIMGAIAIRGEMNAATLRQAHIAAPDYFSEAPVGVSAAIAARFLCIVEDLDPLDAQAADRFFSEYGYYSPTPARTQDGGEGPLYSALYGRSVFNYVEFSTVLCQTPWNAAATQNVQARLIAGVTFWHQPPTPQALWGANSPR